MLPQKSVATQVRVTVAGQEPCTGLSTAVTIPAPSQLSTYPKSHVHGISATHSIVTVAGGVSNIGGDKSSMVIVCVTEEELPHTSICFLSCYVF